MAGTKRGNRSGNQPGGRAAARGRSGSEAARSRADASRSAEKAAHRTGQRGSEAAREGGQAAADALRGAGEAAERGGEAMGEAARQGVQTAASGQSRFVQGAAQEMEKTGLGLAAMVEEATTGMRSLMGAPGFDPSGVQDAQQAVSRLIESVMATNMRFADELLSRTGPSAVVELQRRFMREYFDALAQGGTLLLRAAREAAEASLRPFEEKMRERQGDGRGEDARFEHGGEQERRSAGKVADVMSREVELASPEDTVQQAARLMGERDTGVLPVGENDRLVGMVTDRDLAVRALGAGKDPTRTKLREVMSGAPRYVFADEPIESAAASMAEQQVQRMPVLDRDKRLVGIVSIGDLAREAGGGVAGQALAGVSRPGGRHNQSAR